MVLLMLTYINLKKTPYRNIRVYITDDTVTRRDWCNKNCTESSVLFASGGLEPGWQSSFTPGVLAPTRNHSASPTTHLVISSSQTTAKAYLESLFPAKTTMCSFPAFSVASTRMLIQNVSWMKSKPNMNLIAFFSSYLKLMLIPKKGWLRVRS